MALADLAQHDRPHGHGLVHVAELDLGSGPAEADDRVRPLRHGEGHVVSPANEDDLVAHVEDVVLVISEGCHDVMVLGGLLKPNSLGNIEKG